MFTKFPPSPPLPETEKAAVWAQWSRSVPARAVAYWNWDARLQSWAQPSGFSLSFAERATFVQDHFVNARLAFGVSIFPVTFEDVHDEFPDEERERILKIWSAVIPDSSPKPPLPDAPLASNAWVAALSPGGSVRLVRLQDERHHGVWYVCVFSGLPEETEELFKERMVAWQGGSPDLTHAHPFVLPKPPAQGGRTFKDVAETDFAHYVALSKENRARIACLAVALAGGKFVEFVGDAGDVVVPKHTVVSCDYAPPPALAQLTEEQLAEVQESALRELGELGISPGTCVLPSWFVCPGSGFALGEALHRPEVAAVTRTRSTLLEHTVSSYVECVWNVLVPGDASRGVPGKGAIWLSECCAASLPEDRVVVFGDPVFPTRVLNWPGSAQRGGNRFETITKTQGAFPNVVPRFIKPPEARLRPETLHSESFLGIRFNARSAAQELQKHRVCAAGGAFPVLEHAMVMAQWDFQRFTPEVQAHWELPRAEATLTTKLAVHARKAYDGRAHLPTLDEYACDGFL